jgi:hypothetical protein
MELRELRHRLQYRTCINDTVRYGDAILMRTQTTLTVDTPTASYVYRAASYMRCVERVMRLFEAGDESGAWKVVHHSGGLQLALFDLETAGV